MKVLLLVTWIVNNAVSSYQVEFDTWEKCATARVELMNDQKLIDDAQQMTPLGFQRPAVSAVCAKQ